MVILKILAKKDVYGSLGHKIYTKDKFYEAHFVEEHDLWILDSDFIVNERPMYETKFVIENFDLPEDIRNKRIELLLNKNK